MLCQNTNLYRGPFVPVNGLRGQVVCHGLVEGDEIEIVGLGYSKNVEYLGTLNESVAGLIFDARRFEYVRAIRLKCSGKPIDVWVH